MVEQARPDVVLLDLKLSVGSDCDGLSVCAAVTERFADSRVLVLTTFADEWLILEAIKLGAKGHLVKDVDLTDLVRAVRAVHRGEGAFDSRSTSVVVRWMHGRRRSRRSRTADHARRAGGPGPARPQAEQWRDRKAAVHLRHHSEIPRR
jgi:two-component system, NarL family, response regulator DevR